MVEFGASLRKARESSGVTLDDIFEQTRINMRHLRAIEAGDFPSVPQTYVRAFIREYARLVGLDEDETVRRYNEEAEREKGIPKPPDLLDNSNILPQLDDTIEIITPGSVTPRHVEVDGRAEVEGDETFVPPVRVSDAAQGAVSVVDIRTTKREEAPPPTREIPSDADEGVTIAPAPTGAESESGPAASSASATQSERAEAPPSAVPGDVARTTAEKTTEKVTPLAQHVQAAVPPPPPTQAGHSHKNEVLEKFSGGSPTSKQPPRPRQSVYDTKPPIPGEKPPAARPEQPPRMDSDRRSSSTPISGRTTALIVAGVLIVALIVASYFYFGGDSTAPESGIDSTAIQQSLNAGRFIDSSMTAMPEPVLPPIDSAALPPVLDETADEKARSAAKEDSLVLEAFSNAPVWFSVKMDTTRTERGNMSSNEHRVWRARDRFVLTLGDAGALVFFLNGKELPPLGEEGAVIKNVTISRRNLSPGE